MLVQFLDATSVIHKVFEPPGQSVNVAYYVENNGCLIAATRELYHDNDTSHTKHNLVLLPQSSNCW